MRFFNKLSKSLVVASILCSSAFGLTEGVEYQTLKTPIADAQNTVYEVWSYRCTHCNSHHKANTMGKMAEKLPNVKFGYIIVKTMGDYGKQAAEVLAYAQDQDEKAGRKLTDKNSSYHKVASAYFDAYFKKKERWDNGKSPEKFYAVGLQALGINKAELDKFLTTPRAQEIIAFCDIADPISKVAGTPGFVVNGKYEVNMGSVKSVDNLISIVEELLKM